MYVNVWDIDGSEHSLTITPYKGLKLTEDWFTADRFVNTLAMV